jgi:hypothetical protein
MNDRETLQLGRGGMIPGMTAEEFRALTACGPYRPCSCGVPSSDPKAAEPPRHAADCEYRLAGQGGS